MTRLAWLVAPLALCAACKTCPDGIAAPLEGRYTRIEGELAPGAPALVDAALEVEGGRVVLTYEDETGARVRATYRVTAERRAP